MNKILSSDEVDALLRGLSGGGHVFGLDDDKEIDNSNNEIEEESIPRGRQLWLEILNDRLARKLTTSFSNTIGCRCELNPISIDLQKFGFIMHSLPVPTSINIYSMNPYSGYIYLILDSRLVFALIDYVFGGGFGQAKIEGREYTALEMAVISRLIEPFPEFLSNSFEEIRKRIYPSYIKREINPQFSFVFDGKAIKPDTYYFECTFEVELDTSLGSCIVLYPYSYIEEYENCHDVNKGQFNYWMDILKRKYQRLKREFFQKKISYSKIKYFDYLNSENLIKFVKLTRNEHPQSLAAILSFINNAQLGSKFIQYLPAGVRSEVLTRMLRIKNISNDFLYYLDNTYRNSINKISDTSKRLVTASEIFKNLNENMRNELYAEIAEESQEMADDIRK